MAELITNTEAIIRAQKTSMENAKMASSLDKWQEAEIDKEVADIWEIIADATDKVMSNDEQLVQAGWLVLGGLRHSCYQVFEMASKDHIDEQFDIILEIFRREWLEINDIKMN